MIDGRIWWKFALAVFLLFVIPFGAYAAASRAESGSDTPNTGTIYGQLLTTGGEPLAGGMVNFFNTAAGPPPAHDKYWRVPDFIKRLDSEGKFSIVLPKGKYYMSATRKVAGKAIGPPREGDYYFISSDDKGLPITYSVSSNAQVNLGKIAGAVPFKSSAANYGKGITAIEGTVLDLEGKPVENAFVFAFASAAAVGRPLFASDPSGRDGKFMLRVSDGGKYFLKARSVYGGGPPSSGEMVGVNGEVVPVVAIKGERLGGCFIRVRKFAGRGTQGVENRARQLR